MVFYLKRYAWEKFGEISENTNFYKGSCLLKEMAKIPEISNERLEELAARIKPVVKFAGRIKLDKYSDGGLYYLEYVDLRGSAFSFNPKPIRAAVEINPNSYKQIKTFHRHGTVYFKPSIAEVLAQIPEEDIGRCVAFETLEDTFSEKGGCHVGLTLLYEPFQDNQDNY